VDEAGDPTLFNRKGRLVVGDEGCSRYFILGKLEIEEPEVLSARLATLRQELVADPYFEAVPSMQSEHRKTALAFHAKDDNPGGSQGGLPAVADASASRSVATSPGTRRFARR
jgi:hypothetical protein